MSYTKRRRLAFLVAGALCCGTAHAQFVDRICLGNLETFDRQIIKAGVSYKLSYSVSGSTATVRFAGREFAASAKRGSSWQGIWVKRIDDDIYFSFLPAEGGTIKFQFKTDEWYSGNC